MANCDVGERKRRGRGHKSGGDVVAVAILCLVVAMSICVAHIFHRLVDEPSKRLMVLLEHRFVNDTRQLQGGRSS